MKNLKRKTRSYCKKAVALILAAVLIWGVAPVEDLIALLPTVSAAVPDTVGEPAPNLVADGGFEDYGVGVNLSENTDITQWYRINESGAAPTWISAKTVSSPVKEGDRALAIYCKYNALYRKVEGLKTNTDYAFTYSYYFSENQKMRVAAVISTDSEVDINATNAIVKHTGFSTDLRDSWQTDTLTFNSGNSTSVYILLGYGLEDSTSADKAVYIDNVGVYEISTVAPYYDEKLGTVTAAAVDGEVVLTATAKSSTGLRGWYLNKVEVSAENSISVCPWDAHKYTAEFYNFNLIEKGSFEEYAVDDNLKPVDSEEIWDGITDSEVAGNSDWSSFKVSEDKAADGTKSLKIACVNNTVYKNITGLETDTQYTLSFKYNFPITEEYMRYYAVLDPEDEINTRANCSKMPSLSYKMLSIEEGTTETNEWKEAKLTFNSGDLTEVNLVFLYNSNGTATEYLCYIDDVTLVKDSFAAPNMDNSFDNGYVGDWTASNSKFANVSLDTDDGTNNRLKVDTTLSSGCAYSPTYYLNKGFTYTISFTLDVSEVEHLYVAQVDHNTNVLMYNEDGTLKFTSTQNYINWSFSNTANTWGSKINNSDNSVTNEKYFYCEDTVNTKTGGFHVTVTDSAGTSLYDKNTYFSGFYFTNFQQEYLETPTSSAYDFSKPLTVTNTFTAQQSGPICLGFRLNGLGVYYVDDITVTQERPDTVDTSLVSEGFKAVGVAVRISGKQGIRYKTQIDKALLTNNNPYGIRVTEYGTLVLKEMYLEGEELVYGGSYTYSGNNKTYSTGLGVAYKLGANKDVRFADNDTNIHYTGVVMNIPTGTNRENYQNDYALRSYFKYTDQDGEEQTVYSDTYYSSIYAVAKEAYTTKAADGSFAESDADRQSLYDNILEGLYDRTITVDTSEELFQNYEGISSTVYHCYTFMDDGHDRTYTEAQAAKEMDRLVDSGITSVRTIFKSQFSADYTETKDSNNVKIGETFNGWNWSSSDMQAFYKWAKMLQDRDIDIILNPGWHLKFIVERTSSIPEIFYLLGYEGTYADDKNTPGTTITYGADDVYGETQAYLDAGNTLPEDTEERRMIIASLRFGEFVRQALEACRRNGVYNITYLHPFTETGYEHDDVDTSGDGIIDRTAEGDAAEDGDLIDPTYCYDEYITMVKGMHEALKGNGVKTDRYGNTRGDIRSNYKVIGPSQSIAKNANKYYVENEVVDRDRQISLLGYYLSWEKQEGNEEYVGMIDILSSHMYAGPTKVPSYNKYTDSASDTIYNPTGCYDSVEASYKYYMEEIIEEEGGGDPLNRPFWSDEYFASAGDITYRDGVGAQLTQFAAGMVSAMNRGLQKQLSWQIFDTLFINQTNTGGEFVGGVHCCGTAPSFITLENTCPKVAAGGTCGCQDYTQYASYTPRVTYYGINLLGKYLSNKNATVLKTSVSDYNDEGGVYSAVIRMESGELAVLVVNTHSYATGVKIDFDQLADGEITRYTYNPEGITPTEEATSVASDGSVTVENNGFTDYIADMSFAIYTNYVVPEIDNSEIDSDVNFDMEE